MLLATQHILSQHLNHGLTVYHSVKQESTTRTNGSGRFYISPSNTSHQIFLTRSLKPPTPPLHLAAPAQLLTPTVALLYFGNSTHVPEHLYIFATHKGLQEYWTCTQEGTKAAQRKKSERRGDSQSGGGRTEQVGKEKENPGGEGKMDVGWASEMEEDTTSPQG